MGEEIAISLKNVSKCYKRYTRPADRLKEILLPERTYAQEFWALQDVSFQVMKGETIGIIGRNGAGKSTLLQMICGTLTPTSGVVQVNGRVAALLELGAGFNPEFTGRENVYMNGAIMGLSRQEVDNRFHQIAAFADIGDFIDQAVKTYSSGMYVRLAFASAIHIDPDILIVDEALAVGDMFFQAKCMARMRQMMETGVTVLFVSHDTSSVKSLCQRCAFLEKGKLLKIGKASEVVDTYISIVHSEMNQELKQQVELINKNIPTISQHEKATQDNNLDKKSTISKIFVSTVKEAKFAEGAHRYGDDSAKILDIKLLNSQHLPTDQLDFKEDFTIQVSILFKQDLPSFCIGYSFRDLKGQMLIAYATTAKRIEMPSAKAGEVYVMEIKGTNILNCGVYTITIGIELPVVTNQQHIFIDILENAVVFQSNLAQDPLDRFPGMVYANVEVDFLKITNSWNYTHS
ncbi:MAG: ABC transporter ATP-binding protein [Nostoc sp. NMS1]|uniref:ABC transporter ATP-binding protein n=1 Tax=Nostoc sp. NMS1 TaxID=2815388 RepID=UPI0025ECAA2D|nr:ABC transporter ATP-binding protein [Nostoc sp. NMS1]MBN3906220.1 ABC transporter ATP-binding protein [Nostoc sp. NMS1]